MSRSISLLSGTAAALICAFGAQAQEVKVNGLLQIWYTQMTDSDLRSNSVASYYNLRNEYKENGFSIRRSEIKVSGKVVDNVKYEILFAPGATTSASDPSIVLDANIEYEFLPGLSLRLGQFRPLQTLEGGTTSSAEILFAERAQMARAFGEKRDRGGVISYTFGDQKELGAKLSIGAFNGMNDAIAGKGNDVNAGKDIVARLDMNYGAEHVFGVYTLQGTTDVADKTGMAIAANPLNGWPTQDEIYANKDKTTNYGAFYSFQNDSWIANAEVITGQIGRRFPTLAASAPTVKRQHLNQKFLGWYATGGYKTGAHTFLLRYDRMNYNSGDNWYTSYNPYTQTAPSVASTADFTPVFTETTFGYTYAFAPKKVKAANIKLNYILRSKNFLLPLGTQTTEQGGDTLMAAFQVAF